MSTSPSSIEISVTGYAGRRAQPRSCRHPITNCQSIRFALHRLLGAAKAAEAHSVQVGQVFGDVVD
jgi:hypothetical protein